MLAVMLQVMVHHIGTKQEEDVCLLQEDDKRCCLELATTLDGTYVTINSNSKTSSEVGAQKLSSFHAAVY